MVLQTPQPLRTRDEPVLVVAPHKGADGGVMRLQDRLEVEGGACAGASVSALSAAWLAAGAAGAPFHMVNSPI
jgi:hypothetical protein